MADITLGQFYNAIAQGAREATLNALKDTDFATQTTLAEILSKLSDPATQATLLDVLNKLDDLTAVKNLLTEGDAKVQLKGHDVLTVMDAVAITDTNPHWSDVVDLDLYKRISIFVIDTLNAEKRIRLWPHQSDSAYRGWIYNERDNFFSQYIEVTLGPDQYYRWAWLNTAPGFERLNNMLPPGKLRFRVLCTEPPTSGAITIIVKGERV